MIALIQRVTQSRVTVAGEVTGEIGPGLLVLLGVERDDDEQKANRLCERVLGYRIFSDADGKMNLNEWKGLPLIMRLINSCAIMGYTSSRRNSL